jgi:tetratricopeptide (TPR) repeat protein
MYCNQCGAKLDDSSLLCPNCGHQLPRPPEPKEESPSSPAAGDGLQAERPAEVVPPDTDPGLPVKQRSRGCGWALTAGILAGLALLIVVALGALAVYQGMQERTQLNRAASMEHYQNGLVQIAGGNLELARAEFELALQLDSKNRDAAVRLSEVSVQLANRPTPTSVLRHQTALLLYNEARDLYNKADWEGVISRLEQVQTLEPEYEAEQVASLLVEAYLKAGLKLVDEARMEEAIRQFDRALELSPGSQEVRDQKRLASLYVAGLGYWGANWQGVIDSFRVLYELKPDYKDTRQRLHDAYVAIGDALFNRGDWCAARDRYGGALAISASDQVRSRLDDSAQRCSISPLPTGTPPAKGTFVGRLLKVEDVGRPEAMMIRGYILDAQGKPVTNVRIGLSAFDWSAPPATTNSEGVFAFDGLGNPVTYTVTILDLPALPMQVKTDWSRLIWVEFRPQP